MTDNESKRKKRQRLLTTIKIKDIVVDKDGDKGTIIHTYKDRPNLFLIESENGSIRQINSGWIDKVFTSDGKLKT